MFEKRKFSWLVTLVVVAFVLLSSCKQKTTPPPLQLLKQKR